MTTEKLVACGKANWLVGFVYLAGADGTGLFKVGHSHCLRDRLLKLRPVAPGPLRLSWAVRTNNRERLERYFKQAWSQWHRGGEWYELPQGQVNWFKSATLVNYRDLPSVLPATAEDINGERRSQYWGPAYEYEIVVGGLVAPRRGRGRPPKDDVRKADR